MRGPQPAELKLSETERKELEALVRRHSTSQQLVRRAQMILAADQGKRNGQIAREMGVSTDTVRSWRMRWIGWQAISLDDFEVA
jgi:putative transposase